MLIWSSNKPALFMLFWWMHRRRCSDMMLLVLFLANSCGPKHSICSTRTLKLSEIHCCSRFSAYFLKLLCLPRRRWLLSIKFLFLLLLKQVEFIQDHLSKDANLVEESVLEFFSSDRRSFQGMRFHNANYSQLFNILCVSCPQKIFPCYISSKMNDNVSHITTKRYPANAKKESQKQRDDQENTTSVKGATTNTHA